MKLTPYDINNSKEQMNTKKIWKRNMKEKIQDNPKIYRHSRGKLTQWSNNTRKHPIKD
jgi:hypothetical protein